MNPTDKYLQRGVSAKKEDVHLAIRSLDQGIYPNLFCKVYPDILGGDQDYVNLMSSDGSGTKSILAYLYWLETGDATIFRGIGQDAIVMNLDDMACVGAIDRFLFTSIINRNKHRIPGEIIREIIDGTKEYIDTLHDHGIDITYTGGETADVGDVVRTISVDASMTARMRSDDIIYTNAIAPGNIIIGLASFGHCNYEKNYNSGMGSNGLTSARHDLLSKHYSQYTETIESMVDSAVQYSGNHRLTDVLHEGRNLGQLILSPTMSFTPVLKKIFDTIDRKSIASIVHCTGGGAAKVLHFAEKVRIVKDRMIPFPFLFELIQKESQTSWQEMYQVFNMGTRLEIYVSDTDIADKIIQISKSFGIHAQQIGYVEQADKARVEVHHGSEILTYNP